MKERISRGEFLKRSSIGLGALLAGPALLSSLPASAKDTTGTPAQDFNWKAKWQPERPCRLSPVTHTLAQRGLSGEHGRNLVQATWDFPEGKDDSLSSSTKYGLAAMSVAKNAPLRILPGELIVGSATLRDAVQYKVPLLGEHTVSHTTIGFGKVLQQGYKGLRAEINERLERGGLDDHGTDLLNSMLMCLDAAGVWQKRNIELVRQMQADAPRSERRFYQNIIDTLKRVPENPPANFREAVQSVWSMYAFQRLMGTWSGLGRALIRCGNPIWKPT